MNLFTTMLAAIAVAVPAFASPATLHTIEKFKGETSGKYIVKLKEGVFKGAIVGRLRNANITDEWTVIHGFAGHLGEDALSTLRASPDVESISEDGIAHTCITRFDAPWGLERISHTSVSSYYYYTLDHQYTYDEPAGAGVDIYIVDTGIQISHNEFVPRARWGATFGGYPDADGNGHGTHVAGTAGGRTYGVARNANLIAVKVLSDKGSGAISNIISGLNWIANAVAASRRPSVVNLSLSASASTPLDDAVTALVNRGIHVAVAAGNQNIDAGSTSPARARGTNTIGASDIYDYRAYFSNFGAVVDFFAPGEDIISSWIGDNNNLEIISGTSMASPHVAGLIAYFIGQSGNKSPAAMSALVKSLAVEGVLDDIPPGTVNNLVQNA
ncbi:putative peptidase S8 family protein [Lyophyllum shimeji]|uniref:Peptidase S8 family protein n=1 Tax=Lyophyllum shimeji TaxID=47721 RepID=A0A9P3PW93_LYOSH|nr:putative peptidase S8 family protein [Lyophyllum shimeji]GLB43169.1 putative peptidase S8 family protein [Lyophyllum shimeji]